jgi:hypothetical protein
VAGHTHDDVLRVAGGGKTIRPDQPPGDLFVTIKYSLVEIGSLVQWVSDGVAQFSKPRRVTNIDSHNGQLFVFVEGSRTAIPISEAYVVHDRKPPANTPPRKPEHAPADADDWSG